MSYAGVLLERMAVRHILSLSLEREAHLQSRHFSLITSTECHSQGLTTLLTLCCRHGLLCTCSHRFRIVWNYALMSLACVNKTCNILHRFYTKIVPRLEKYTTWSGGSSFIIYLRTHLKLIIWS